MISYFRQISKIHGTMIQHNHKYNHSTGIKLSLIQIWCTPCLQWNLWKD